jgi:hypothetical protein
MGTILVLHLEHFGRLEAVFVEPHLGHTHEQARFLIIGISTPNGYLLLPSDGWSGETTPTLQPDIVF